MMRALFLLFVLVFARPAPASAADTAFHPPQTEAEKVLARILSLSESHEESLYAFAVGAPQKDHSHDAVYARLFTPALLKEWRTAQAEALRDNCDGKYQEGMICGLEYSVLNCGDDSVETFLYRTLKQTKTRTIVRCTVPQYTEDYVDPPGPSYFFIKKKSRWVMDGADLGGGRTFNIPPPPQALSPISDSDNER